MAKSDLLKAKTSKNDEFYTQYHDIEKEINAYLEYDPNVFENKTILLPCDDPEWSNFTKFFAQNFERLKLKKLISTSYAPESKKIINYQPTLFEVNDPRFDKIKTVVNGKIFTLTQDKTGDGKIDVNDLEWTYLEGDGDFRSKEIKNLRDEADIIITNPPFSLFREFLAWIVEADKKFVIIGNMNAITYKEVFPLIKANKMWTGSRFNKRLNGKNMTFLVPDNYELSGTEVELSSDGKKMISVAGTGWYTNLEHGLRHEPLPLMTMADNLKFSKHKEIKENGYLPYDNYDAIEVPFTDSIPNDYDGVMGVPISFLTKYNPNQFEIVALGIGEGNFTPTKKYEKFRDPKTKNPISDKRDFLLYVKDTNGKYLTAEDYIVNKVYARILIKHKK
jgi:hypothetical protein